MIQLSILKINLTSENMNPSVLDETLIKNTANIESNPSQLQNQQNLNPVSSFNSNIESNPSQLQNQQNLNPSIYLNFAKREKSSFYVWKFISTLFLFISLLLKIIFQVHKNLNFWETDLDKIYKTAPIIAIFLFSSTIFYIIISIIIWFKVQNKNNYLNKKIKKYEDVIGALCKNLGIMEFGTSNRKCIENIKSIKKMPDISRSFNFFFTTFLIVDCVIKSFCCIPIVTVPFILNSVVHNWLIFYKEKRLRDLKEKFGNLMELPFFEYHLKKNNLYGKTMEKVFDYYYINHDVASLFLKN